ncbi:MAG: hypothetical protein RL885_23075 [Planctomycetota bacterium]
MAPEQLELAEGAITPKVDAYALGVIGFKLLVGLLLHVTESLTTPQAVAYLADAEAPRASGVSLPSAETLELELERGATISGRVLSSEGHPLAKAGVLAFRAGSELEPPRSFDRAARRRAIGAWARPDGHFDLAGVPDGEYWVVGFHPELLDQGPERVLIQHGLSGASLELRMEGRRTTRRARLRHR